MAGAPILAGGLIDLSGQNYDGVGIQRLDHSGGPVDHDARVRALKKLAAAA